jgi:hypothetical protein
MRPSLNDDWVMLSERCTWRSNMSLCSEKESGKAVWKLGSLSPQADDAFAPPPSGCDARPRDVPEIAPSRTRSTALIPAYALDVAAIQSRMLLRASRRAALASGVPPAPNSMSKASRGSRIIGSGSFGDFQLIESVYTQE